MEETNMKKSLTSILIGCCLAIALIFSLASCSDECDHAYDNACDATCNECGETRAVGAHDYSEADCNTPKTCKMCGATDGQNKAHSYDNACDTTCNECDGTRVITHDFSGLELAYDDHYHYNKCSGCTAFE